MRVNRIELLKVLESVTPGLASKEIIEQSTCFVFTEGDVITYNDEVSCRRKAPVDLDGVVHAAPLLEILNRWQEDEIDVSIDGGELLLKGKKKKSGLRMQHEVLLAIYVVEVPKEWKALPADFCEAIGVVHECASGNASEFCFTCVHHTKEFVEAHDRFQVARYPLDLPVDKSFLIRANTIKEVVGYDMTEISETKSWVHFRNPAGLVMSCRKWVEDYRDLSPLLVLDGTNSVVLPGNIEEAIGNATVFSKDNAISDHILVELGPDRLVLEGRGVYGWHKEMKEVSYEGPDLRFLVSPHLLESLSSKSNTCRIGQGRLIVDTGKFTYVSCTEIAKTEEV